MESRMTEISSQKSGNIKIGIIPGHFATNHSHVNYYVGLDSIKRNYKMAKETARVIAGDFLGTSIDTIIPLEGTQMLAAYLADRLSDSYQHSVNHGKDISVITPEFNSNNQMLFRDNAQGMIWNKQVLLMISSASTGWTVMRMIECLTYYSGKLIGVSALFSAIDEVGGIPIYSVFRRDDLPDYISSTTAECPMCREKIKIDAIVNDHGYSKI